MSNKCDCSQEHRFVRMEERIANLRVSVREFKDDHEKRVRKLETSNVKQLMLNAGVVALVVFAVKMIFGV